MTNYTKLWIKKIKPGLVPTYNQIFGIILLVLGILSIIWTPYQLMMDERIRMRPGMPSYEWWLEPPPCGTKIFIYNITNADRFLSGIDPKLVMEEVGPVIYQEVWKHDNVVFNPNGTISYVVSKNLQYAREEKSIDLNATIIIPNLAVLLTASYFWNASIFTKMGLNYVFNFLDSQPIINTTIYNFLHNNSDPFLSVANTVAPFIAPVRNLGIVDLMYRESIENATAFVGTERGHQVFSLIDKYHGRSNIPGHPDSCKYKMTNSSEGITYNQLITKETVLRYYRKSLCRVIPLYFDGEGSSYGLNTYKFAMTDRELDRIHPPEDDCFDNTPTLPNGITDVSKCFFSFPLVASYIHFDNTDRDLDIFPVLKVPKGKPTPKSYVYVHPASGVPLISSAALQGNMYIRELTGFKTELQRFSNQIIPLFWIHYYNDELPLKVVALTHFVMALQYIGGVITIIFFSSGVYCIWKSFKRKSQGRKDTANIKVASGKEVSNSELETFLKS